MAYPDVSPPDERNSSKPPPKCSSKRRHKPIESPRPKPDQPETKPKITPIIPSAGKSDQPLPKDNGGNSKPAKYQGSGGDNVQSRQGNEADQRKGLELLNVIRQEVNLPPLKFSATLELAALRHSQYQLSINNMTHDDPIGGLGVRARKSGFQGGTLAENVAFGQRDEESVMQSWKKSPGHYKNMINPTYTHVGLAKVSGYWTQFFGRSSGNK
ncbi:hypothetical protein IWQ62_003418 [Dispira parvispora]|uniref:SCP domain-containing protein n=1 Tax=Dispira parvispora TaxID=1520584 RepID=A0A9W8E1N7_9FUNG|nr:hypothetical protein IWQ62_003418 [Dispira parvispora]